ncbi:30-kDa cleavage and polyadenylation specificity factor 30-like [Primulina eburnea]|uniref:30-kDa cleavage and polyadenylation specificity factor 30-like n=1 Tax=Primulina eburnea TaxID=1245227 RepID=UPI003C6C0B03
MVVTVKLVLLLEFDLSRRLGMVDDLISRDLQELEPSIGEQLASLLYLENGNENSDIVPFEDNEEEEEEESEEDDESLGQAFGVQGRGRGRGMMWPPQIPLARGARPFASVQGFPRNMLGGDGFSYRAMNRDGFHVPEIFGMAAPRGFGPYGPSFSGDFVGPAPSMMFPGRPSGGFGMVMGSRAPFMGIGAATMTRAGRTVGMPSFYPPPQSHLPQNSYRVNRDMRAPTSYRSGNSDRVKGTKMVGSDGGPEDEGQHQQSGKTQQYDHFSAGNYRNDESSREYEAPRRSRRGRKKEEES